MFRIAAAIGLYALAAVFLAASVNSQPATKYFLRTVGHGFGLMASLIIFGNLLALEYLSYTRDLSTLFFAGSTGFFLYAFFASIISWSRS